jgi:hypothetical protein
MRRIWIPYLILLLFVASAMQAQVVLQRCDIKNLWTGSNTLSIDNADKKEGAASLRFTGSGTNWFSKTFSRVQTGIDETGYLSLWLYVDQPQNFDGEGAIEITSSGGPDVDEYSWSMGSLGLTSGWNELLLPISSAVKLGTPNLQAINYFRIYQNLSASITAKIDDIRFLPTASPVASDDPLDIAPIDFSTLDGKVMFGYQGWFLHPDDGSVFARWKHWGGTMSSTEDLTVDMFPDVREYEADELFPTGNNFFSYADGRTVRVYSAYTKKTVMRHMKWVRDYGLDGVFLQRFMTSIGSSTLKISRDTVTRNIMDGCEKYGRAFVNMWDISGYAPGNPNGIINDWKHLVDDLNITESPSYLHHRGKPLVAIWGFLVREEFPESDLQTLLDFFNGASTPEKYQATVMLGVDHDFHERPAWFDEMAQAGVISPWAVGRFSNDDGQQNFMNEHVLPGKDWCDQHNVDFLPVIWPGFSWANLKDDVPNKRPRRGGNFFWTQANRVISGNAKSIYIAMFDEIDESTAMYKLAENDDQTPDQGYWLALDADGYDLPSDWYLRCAKLATEVVRGHTDNRTILGTPPDGIDAFSVKTIAARCGEDNGRLLLRYPRSDAENLYEFSVDGGASYPYTTPQGTGELPVNGLEPGVYNVWVRNADGSYPTDLGPYTIFSRVPDAELFEIDATCVEEGKIVYLLDDLPYGGEVEFSVDGGAAYTFTSTEDVWRDTIPGLVPGDYSVWIRYVDEHCPTELETVTITTAVKPIEVYPMLDGQSLSDTDTLYACPGSSLILFCYPSESGYTWSLTGPNEFSSGARTVQVANALTPEMFGIYTIRYIDPIGCEQSRNFVLLQDEDCEVHSGWQRDLEQWIDLYPNPADEILSIENRSGTSLFLDVLDISGQYLQKQRLLETGYNRIDISRLASGMYYLMFSDEQGNRFRKGIVKTAKN